MLWGEVPQVLVQTLPWRDPAAGGYPVRFQPMEYPTLEQGSSEGLFCADHSPHLPSPAAAQGLGFALIFHFHFQIYFSVQ